MIDEETKKSIEQSFASVVRLTLEDAFASVVRLTLEDTIKMYEELAQNDFTKDMSARQVLFFLIDAAKNRFIAVKGLK